MLTRMLARPWRFLIIIALVLGFLSACQQTPSTPSEESLDAFDITLPAQVTQDEAFSLTIQAVGSEGSQPFEDYSDNVTLTLSQGSINPTAVQLDKGSAVSNATITGTAGNVTVTVTGGGKTGTATTMVLGIVEILPGDPEAPATGNIPELDFVAREEDYSNDHPDLAGSYISFNTLILAFELDTTVAEANAVLSNINAEIVGGLPGLVGEASGLLFLRVPTESHQAMIALLENLRADPQVRHVVQDTLLETTLIPQDNDGNPANWTWTASPAGGNWGLELIGVPQMWNLNAAIEKSGSRTVTGILDIGFADTHEDLIYDQNQTPGRRRDHGTHVAGIIAASFDNAGIGVDGVSPYADLVVRTRDTPASGGSVFDGRESFGDSHISSFFDLISSRPDIKVVNISLGYNWARAGINQNTSSTAQSIASEQGSLLGLAELIWILTGHDLPLVVVAAGNDSNDIPNGSGGFVLEDAMYASPFANAALEFDMPNIIVVESVANSPASTGGATRSSFSNINAHIAAPGSEIMSTSYLNTSTTDFYESMSGTSMAAPHVTGLVSYLYSLDAGLLHSEIRDLLTDNSVAVAGGASNRIDAFASVMDLDDLRNNDHILTMLLDIDDGSPDGNQRLLIPPTGADFIGEDADGDGGRGDGQVDMSDFRRFRDWLLQVENSPGLTLDGSAAHPKKDVNGNGSVESASAENLYPRGDFNGDGVLSRTASNFVPGNINTSVTDLQVLQELFSDSHYNASDLANLINSADLEVWPKNCLDRADVVSVNSSIRASNSNTVLETRTHDANGPRKIYTAAVNAGPYTASIEALNSAGDVVFSTSQSFPFGLGSDAFWNPSCQLELVLPVLVFEGVEIYQPNNENMLRFKLAVENWQVYPQELFDPAPELPPCGENPNASRTWVDIFDANSEERLYGFCALGSPADLQGLWFGWPLNAQAPEAVFITMTDRLMQQVYTSNSVELLYSVITDYNLSPASPSELAFGERVNLNFSYFSNEGQVMRIFGRPFTDGALSPDYAAHSSPAYTSPIGEGDGYFTISSGDAPVVVDQLRFQILNEDQSSLLFEMFVDVNYRFIPALPDLVITEAGISLAQTCEPGMPILIVTANVENIGTGPSPERLDVGMVNALDIAGSGWGNGIGLNAIAPGANQTVSFPIYYLMDDPAYMEGSHTFDAVVNRGNWIAESDTTNNHYPPNLSITIPKGFCSEIPQVNPVLVFEGVEIYQPNNENMLRFKLAVENWQVYPQELFDPAPELPPCGENPNASRTWVDIFDANSEERLYGFCALGSPADLQGLWFGWPLNAQAPEAVFITMTDRLMQQVYTSNSVELLYSVITDYNLSPASPSELAFGERVNLNFSYFSNEGQVMRIFGRPFTDGALSPDYAAHGSPAYTSPVGEGDGYFTISSGDAPVVVDQLRFQILNEDQSSLLFEMFVDVNYTFVPALPDLVITEAGISLAQTCQPGMPILYVTANVKNIGTGPSPERLDVGMVNALDIAGSGWGNGIGLNAIAPGANQTVSFPIYYLMDDPAYMEGSHTFDAVVNRANWIAESDTTNNIYPPNLSITIPEGFCSETPQVLCINFEDPPFPLGIEYGSSVGHVPGDLAFTEQGIPVTVHNFDQGGSFGFNYARVDSPSGLSGQSMGFNNINLRFDFSRLDFIVGEVSFDFLDFGGSENIAVNSSAITSGELSSGTYGGVPTIISRVDKGGSGKLTGTVRDLMIGGQEFFLDNVCVYQAQ